MLPRLPATVLATLVAMQQAMAADLPRSTTAAMPASPPVFTWTGFHIGLNAGYVAKRDRLDGVVPDLDAVLPGAGALAIRQSSDGFTGGGQLGYDHQFGAGHGVVVGIEADLAYTDLDRTTALPLPPGVPLQAAYDSQLKELGTVRGRLGYAVGPVLVYGTGGFAYGEALRTASVTAGGATLARMVVDDFETGYAVGGGLEYALLTSPFLATLPGTVTLRAEYLHYNLGQRATPLSMLGQDTVTRMRTDGDLGRVGLNYKF